MKSDLIIGWIFVGLALLMIICIIYGCFIGNWAAILMCSFALILNVCNAISHFTSYNWCKDYHKTLDSMEQYIQKISSNEENYIK